MKKVLSVILTAAITLSLTACGENPKENQNSQTTTQSGQTIASEDTTANGTVTDEPLENTDKHYYKTVRIIGYVYSIIPSLQYVMENQCGYADYLPTLTIHYNTRSGMAESAEYSTYYSYQPDADKKISEQLQSDMDSLSTGEGELLSRFSNIRTENMETEGVSKLTFDIDISSYFTYFEQYINLYFIEREQNIEEYKNAVFYSCVDGYYDPQPTCEDRENYFYDEITCRRIEWSD